MGGGTALCGMEGGGEGQLLVGQSGKCSIPTSLYRQSAKCSHAQDTGVATYRVQPISAPSGIYQGHYELFVTCAAERLDRVGRDLPDPAYVADIEANIRLFLQRVQAKKMIKELEHLAFILVLDEEQGRTLSKDDLQTRLRIVWDGVKGMEWKNTGVMTMGLPPSKKVEHPMRAEHVWLDVIKGLHLHE